MGVLFPTEWKNKIHVPYHQPVMNWQCLWMIYEIRNEENAGKLWVKVRHPGVDRGKMWLLGLQLFVDCLILFDTVVTAYVLVQSAVGVPANSGSACYVSFSGSGKLTAASICHWSKRWTLGPVGKYHPSPTMRWIPSGKHTKSYGKITILNR